MGRPCSYIYFQNDLFCFKVWTGLQHFQNPCWISCLHIMAAFGSVGQFVPHRTLMFMWLGSQLLHNRDTKQKIVCNKTETISCRLLPAAEILLTDFFAWWYYLLFKNLQFAWVELTAKYIYVQCNAIKCSYNHFRGFLLNFD